MTPRIDIAPALYRDAAAPATPSPAALAPAAVAAGPVPPPAFGAQVFSTAVQRQRLPRDIFARLQATIARGETLDPDLAGIVARAMKDWALE